MRKITPILVFMLAMLLDADLSAAYPGNRNPSDPAGVSEDRRQLMQKIRVDRLNAISCSLQHSSTQQTYSCAAKALGMAEAIDYKKGMAEACLNIGIFYLDQRDYLSALKMLLLSNDLAKEIGSHNLQSQTLHQIGDLYYKIKRGDLSQRYFSLALTESQRIHDTNRIIITTLGLSNLSSDSNKSKTAERYLNYSLFLSLKQHNQVQEAFLYKHLGILHFRRKAYGKALFYWNSSIRLYQKLDQPVHIGSLYTLIANIYEEEKDLQQTLDYHKIALSYRLGNHQDEQVASSLLNIGNTYLLMGQQDSAQLYLEKGISMAEELKKNYLLKKGYGALYVFYKRKNNIVPALANFEKFIVYKDRVNDEDNKLLIATLETNRIISQNEKETSALKAQNFIQKLEVQNKKLLVLALLSLSLLVISFLIVAGRALVRKIKEKKLVEKKNAQLQVEIREQVIQNEELSRREQEYRFLADHSADLISLMDSTFKCLYVSPSSQLFLGYSPEELVELQDYRELIHPESRNSFAKAIESMIEFGDSLRIIYQVIRKDGSAFWVESNINPVFETSSGKLKAMLSITRDVSSHVVKEEAWMEQDRQKEMLIREVHHRVKNNLAILTGLVNMQKSEFTDSKTLEVFSDLQFRVKAMALVHDQLYRSQNIKILPIGNYLSNLVRIVSSAFTTKTVEIHQSVYDEPVEVEITLPLGLIVNELLTNAFKYAFPGNRNGNIWVTYKKAATKKNGTEMRCLTVRDDGIGLPPGFDITQRTSMGSTIIRLLTGELHGKLKVENKKGASFSIILPLER